MRPTRRREGELVAIAFNQKEQRLLEKSVATIRLEATYSLKLLDLDNRNVKVYFRQLRDKVSRLKSHLSVEEIQQLRQLEEEGKLQPVHPPVNLGSALKIAATNRRLHPAHLRHSTTPTAGHRTPARPPHTPESTAAAPSHNQTLKRSNSVTGVFVDVPPSPTPDHRPLSASIMLDRQPGEVTSVVTSKPASKAGQAFETPADVPPSPDKAQKDGEDRRPASREYSITPDNRERFKTSTPVTPPETQQQSSETRSSSSPPKLTCQSAGVSRSSSSYVRTPFSSHSAREKALDDNGSSRCHSDFAAFSPRPRYSAMDKDSTFLALLQDDGMDDLDQELYEERRVELLEGEQLRATSLTKRKDTFLKELDTYLRNNPPPSIRPRHYSSSRQKASAKKKEAGAEEDDAVTEAVFRRRRVEFDLNPTSMPEADYRERLRGLWTDMNKCRYLRLSDDRLDLSGVNTLATDTLKLYKVLKKQDRKVSLSARPPVKDI